jgi:hypothetical protein
MLVNFIIHPAPPTKAAAEATTTSPPCNHFRLPILRYGIGSLTTEAASSKYKPTYWHEFHTIHVEARN